MWRRDPKKIEKYQFLHHFFPHPVHKVRARLLSHKALTLYSLGFLLILFSVKLLVRVYPGVLGYASDISVQELLELTNKRRVAEGLSTLVLNPALTEAAQEKAEDMFKNNYWAHISPAGTEPWDFILDAEYDYTYAGENLAKNFGNSKDVVEAWYNSPSHKENLMNKNYDEIGFAVVNGVLDGYETTLVVQMFGRPRDPSLLASASDQAKILESLATERPEEKSALVPSKQLAVNFPQPSKDQVLPALDVPLTLKTLGVGFTAFLILLLLLDVWYSKKYNIAKLTGHSFAHIMFLVFSLVGMLFALMPGKIL